MNPSTPTRRSLAFIVAAMLAVPCARAQDGQTVNIGEMLQQLRQLREATATKTKADKQRAIQEVSAAAASGEGAVNAWEKAVMATQFDGVAKEQTAFKAWRDNEGEALKEAEAKNAARLYFQYLALTLQRSSGTTVKDLIPALVNYTKELQADLAMIENLDDSIKKEKEKEKDRPGGGRGGNNPRKSNDGEVKKMHDSILHRPLGGSLPVQWLKLGEWVNVDHWEGTPSNLDGIYEKTILPEWRALKDQRVLEYWDMKIKREGDSAAKSKLEFEHDKFLTLKMPALLWRKAVDMAALGAKNRAATEMFNLIRKYPQHPDAGEWMGRLEEMLMPATAAPAATVPAAP